MYTAYNCKVNNLIQNKKKKYLKKGAYCSLLSCLEEVLSYFYLFTITSK